MVTNAAVQLASVVLWALSKERQTRASIASALMCFVDALILCVLSHLEHTRTVKPSTIVEVYIFFSGVFDAVQIRTLWLQGNTVLAAVMSAGLAVKIWILGLEMAGKRSFLAAPYTKVPPEMTSGVFSRCTFCWLNNLFKAGFYSNLSLQDLTPVDSRLSSVVLRNQLQHVWDHCERLLFSH